MAGRGIGFKHEGVGGNAHALRQCRIVHGRGNDRAQLHPVIKRHVGVVAGGENHRAAHQRDGQAIRHGLGIAEPVDQAARHGKAHRAGVAHAYHRVRFGRDQTKGTSRNADRDIPAGVRCTERGRILAVGLDDPSAYPNGAARRAWAASESADPLSLHHGLHETAVDG